MDLAGLDLLLPLVSCGWAGVVVLCLGPCAPLLAGIGKLSTADGKAFADPEVLRRLTSSVSCALDEAAAALTRMRAENTLNAGQADKYVSQPYWPPVQFLRSQPNHLRYLYIQQRTCVFLLIMCRTLCRDQVEAF